MVTKTPNDLGTDARAKNVLHHKVTSRAEVRLKGLITVNEKKNSTGIKIRSANNMNGSSIKKADGKLEVLFK